MVTERVRARWAWVAIGWVLLLWVGGLGGCAAALPVVGDAATTAVNATVALFEGGIVVSYQAVSLEDATGAVKRMQRELDLMPTGEETSADEVKFMYEDQRGQEIEVTLVRRTRRVTAIYVAVGLLGKAGMGELVLRQILHDLPPAASEPGWPK